MRKGIVFAFIFFFLEIAIIVDMSNVICDGTLS